MECRVMRVLVLPSALPTSGRTWDCRPTTSSGLGWFASASASGSRIAPSYPLRWERSILLSLGRAS